MDNYVILADIACDLPDDYYVKNRVQCVPMSFMLDGSPVIARDSSDAFCKDFYRRMRAGAPVSTSANGVGAYTEYFTAILSAGSDLLFLGFSSGLSASFQSARLAAEEVAPKFPERKLRVVDSLAASLGYGLFVDKAVQLREQGLGIDEAVAALEACRLNLQHLFTVDDLMFLQRGGRISKSVAIVGSIVGVKPMLDVDPEGRLRACSKKRGRKNSVLGLVDWMEKLHPGKNIDVISISHGDCEADADLVIAEAKRRFGVKRVIKNYVGPYIGAHSGPGTLALFFFGDTRV